MTDSSQTSPETSMNIRQNIHAEASFVRTEKTPAETSIVSLTVPACFHSIPGFQS